MSNINTNAEISEKLTDIAKDHVEAAKTETVWYKKVALYVVAGVLAAGSFAAANYGDAIMQGLQSLLNSLF